MRALDPEVSGDVVQAAGAPVGEFPPGAQDADPAYGVAQAADADGFARRVEADEVERTAVGGEGARTVVVSRRQAPHSAVDGRRVAPYPVAQPFEPLSLFRSYGAVRARADVEQQVSSHADRLREVPHELPHGFVVHILWPVAPGVVDGQAQLPVGLRRRHRQALLGRGVVAVAEQPGVAHRVGCQITDQPRQFGHPPLLGRALPLAVEPEQIRSEPGEQLAHLAVPVVEVALPGPRVLAPGAGET